MILHVDMKCHVLSWWDATKLQYPRLYEEAIKMLIIPATSVPTERIFSVLSYLFNQNRCKLSSDHINEIMLLNNILSKY